MALRDSVIARLRRDTRITESKFRVLHSGEKKTDVDALMEDDERIVRMRDKLMLAEAEREILSAVTKGYEALRNAASREISRRLGERAAID